MVRGNNARTNHGAALLDCVWINYWECADAEVKPYSMQVKSSRKSAHKNSVASLAKEVKSIIKEEFGKSKILEKDLLKNITQDEVKKNRGKKRKQITALKRDGQGNTLSNINNPFPSDLLDNLAVSGIFLLRSVSSRFAKAQFFCQLCEYHCDDVRHCERHCIEERHKRLWDIRFQQIMLTHLPEPNDKHIKSLDQLMLDVCSQVMLSEIKRKQWLDVVEVVNKRMQEKFPDFELCVYGSIKSMTALKTSDVNIHIIGKSALYTNVFVHLFSILSSSEQCCHVKKDFGAKVPEISFESKSLPGVVYRINIPQTYQGIDYARLLSMYVSLDARTAKLIVLFRYWAKLCMIDQQERGTLPGYIFSLLAVFFLQRTSIPVLPTIEVESESDVTTTERVAENFSPPKNWKSSNVQCIGELWIEMFKFYCVTFPTNELVVSIRTAKSVKRSEKKWSGKRLAVEDPFRRKCNLFRSVSHGHIYEYIQAAFLRSYKYFGIPQAKTGPVWIPTNDGRVYRIVRQNFSNQEYLAQLKEDEENEIEESVIKYSEESFFDKDKILDVNDQDYYFGFSAKHFADKERPALYCSCCQRRGHLQDECPDLKLPKMPEMKALKDQALLSKLKKEIEVNQQQHELTEEEQVKRQAICKELERHINKSHPTAVLRLFGSSYNGFGFRNSDLDICMVFSDKEGSEVNFVKVIEDLKRLLCQCSLVKSVEAVPTAKVPIVKFEHCVTRHECDISLYNVLAHHNTEMLRCYTQVDSRVKPLGYAIKVFAKNCGMCDASKGSLSSYAYILMLIYYLQQVQPPVLPVLQELHEGEKPEKIIDAHNAWYFGDISSLEKRWAGLGKNKMSMEELWLGLLRFYSHEFDLLNNVVCIRQLKILNRFEKLWNGQVLAVEDPFDLTHNLGAALSRKMNFYIQKKFHVGCRVFGNFICDKGLGVFETRELVAGGPPNDRGCKICSCIGHLARECPKAKQKRDEMSCYECGQIGHISRNCPVRNQAGQHNVPNNQASPLNRQSQGKQSGRDFQDRQHPNRKSVVYTPQKDRRNREQVVNRSRCASSRAVGLSQSVADSARPGLHSMNLAFQQNISQDRFSGGNLNLTWQQKEMLKEGLGKERGKKKEPNGDFCGPMRPLSLSELLPHVSSQQQMKYLNVTSNTSGFPKHHNNNLVGSANEQQHLIARNQQQHHKVNVAGQFIGTPRSNQQSFVDSPGRQQQPFADLPGRQQQPFADSPGGKQQPFVDSPGRKHQAYIGSPGHSQSQHLAMDSAGYNQYQYMNSPRRNPQKLMDMSPLNQQMYMNSPGHSQQQQMDSPRLNQQMHMKSNREARQPVLSSSSDNQQPYFDMSGYNQQPYVESPQKRQAYMDGQRHSQHQQQPSNNQQRQNAMAGMQYHVQDEKNSTPNFFTSPQPKNAKKKNFYENWPVPGSETVRSDKRKLPGDLSMHHTASSRLQQHGYQEDASCYSDFQPGQTAPGNRKTSGLPNYSRNQQNY